MTLSDFLALPGAVEHDGGPCPVPLNGYPTVFFRVGVEVEEAPASMWTLGDEDWWQWQGDPDDNIIAYIPENDNG